MSEIAYNNLPHKNVNVVAKPTFLLRRHEVPALSASFPAFLLYENEWEFVNFVYIKLSEIRKARVWNLCYFLLVYIDSITKTSTSLILHHVAFLFFVIANFIIFLKIVLHTWIQTLLRRFSNHIFSVPLFYFILLSVYI